MPATPPAVVRTAVPEEMGHELGKYRLIAEIARGGMGIAYLAVLPGPDRFRKLVVVKELRPELVRVAPCLQMFMDEARLAARLNHPNIVQTLEVAVEESRRFIAMEYLDGQPLQQLVQRALNHSTRMPLRMHLGVLLDVLSALEYAHGLSDFDGTPLGVVHRDVSPHNIIVTYEGQIKLVDFGISETKGAVEDTRGGVLQGKMRYMAPEQAAGLRVDRRADLFAVGAMLWEAVVGHRPWEGQSDSAVLQKLIVGAVPRIRDAWPDVDPGLAAIVERAMCVDPAARYATASAMREDLERFVGTRNLTPPSARSLGGWVSKLFVRDRDERRRLIETHLRALNGTDCGQPASQPRVKVETSEVMSGVYAEPSLSDGTISSPSRARRRDLNFVVVAAAAGFGALLAFYVLGAPRSRPDEVHVAATGAAAAGPVAIAPVVGTAGRVRVLVIASPPSAQVYLDEVAVSNPYVMDHLRDTTTHHLRIECPGYETMTRTLAFADDIDLEIGLSRDPAVSVPRQALRPTPPAVATNCQPPYVVDSVTGKKHWKLECLESEATRSESPAAAPGAAPRSSVAQSKPVDAGRAYTPFSSDQL